MQPEDRDAAYLHDAIEAGKSITKIIQGTSYERHLQNELVRLAVERQLTIVGEATKRMSKSFREAHPEIAWSKIVGLRNVLMHEYDEIDQPTIFAIATERVPKLVEQLKALLPPIPPDPEPES